MNGRLWSLAAACLLAACGGGGGDPQGIGHETPQAVASTSSLTVTPSSLDVSIAEGSTATAALSATYTGRAPKATLNVVVQPTGFAPDAAITDQGGGHFAVRLTTLGSLAVGNYSGTVTLRMCRESPCKTVISGTTVVVPYAVHVTAIAQADWSTFQGNARHDGFVPVTLDPARFASAWEWRRTTSGTLGFINSVVSENGKVYVSDDEYFGSVVSLYALNESDGSLAWRHDFMNAPALNPPGVSNGVVYVATTGSTDTFLYAFRASDGTPMWQSAFGGQWPHVLAPTVKDGRVYTNGGYYGGGVYAYDATQGTALWSRFAGDDDMTTPAVDDSRVYYYSGTSLEVYNAADGQSLASITDPYQPGWGYSYHAAPMLGSPDNVIAFSGGAFSGRASSSVEQYGSRPLVNYSVQSQVARWRTANAYLTQPATQGGVVYAGRSAPAVFEAISESTGQVLWSWTPPATDFEFHRNVLLTNNLAFVSTEHAVYAIDLATHQAVWSYPAPGMLALSRTGLLYIVEGATQPTGRLIAIKVQ